MSNELSGVLSEAYNDAVNRAVWIINPQGTEPIFKGTEAAAVEFLEQNPSDQPRGVYVANTADILTESEFLDLAT